MKITKQELIKMGACKEGMDRFIAQTNNTDEPVEASSLVGGENSYSDLLWLASEKLPKERIIRFACDCALLNIELIKPYTDEHDMIVDFLRNPTKYSTATARDVAIHARKVRNTAIDVYDHTAADAGASVHGAAHGADNGINGALFAVYGANNKEKVNELLKELFA